MISKIFSYINRNLLKKKMIYDKIEISMSFFVVNFYLFKKKLNPGISRDGNQFCPVIPGYGKASEILNPIHEVCILAPSRLKMEDLA